MSKLKKKEIDWDLMYQRENEDFELGIEFPLEPENPDEPQSSFEERLAIGFAMMEGELEKLNFIGIEDLI